MTLPAPTYDLVLLLDPQAEEEARAKILTDARSAIEAQGELLRQDDWGDRSLTYPIDRKADAEYHLLQFHAGAPEMLNSLDRSLRITDGIMRFRIIKLKPGVPDAPDVLAAPTEEPQSEQHSEPQAPAETVAVVETAAVVEPGGETAEVIEAEVIEAEVVEADAEVGEPA
jgi:small subunit ribosomal protein S6